jgi:hypothetical protein
VLGTLQRQTAYAALAPMYHYPGEFLSAFRAHEMDALEVGL